LKRSHLVREIVETLVLTILIFFAIRFVIQSYHVSGISMQPGLVDGQYVMVNKMAYLLHGPERGDVIVFHNPQKPNEDLIKRVIGLPGDIIRTDNSHVWINNVLLNEAYISSPSNPETGIWTVPQGQYFVLGDNRPISEDSRYIGSIPTDYIVGKAVIIFWPINQIHSIHTVTSTYSLIKRS
jgi:signal peptidase I